MSEAQVERCVSLLDHKEVNNFESRMAAEVRLYWIILKKCSASGVILAEAEAALDDWNQEWSSLLGKCPPQPFGIPTSDGINQISHGPSSSRWGGSSRI